jgi:hypothetical protein
MGNSAKGDIMKRQEENMHTERESSHTNNEAAGMVFETGLLDREAIARLAYSYWEARGRQDDSPDEHWLRAEAELRNRLAPAAREQS